MGTSFAHLNWARNESSCFEWKANVISFAMHTHDTCTRRKSEIPHFVRARMLFLRKPAYYVGARFSVPSCKYTKNCSRAPIRPIAVHQSVHQCLHDRRHFDRLSLSLRLCFGTHYFAFFSLCPLRPRFEGISCWDVSNPKGTGLRSGAVFIVRIYTTATQSTPRNTGIRSVFFSLLFFVYPVVG